MRPLYHAKPEPAAVLNRVVALEGNIGVGKSTLCAKFEEHGRGACSVYKEQANEKFLALFYSAPAQYCFAFQCTMLSTRRYQLALAQHDAKYGRIPPQRFYFWDRSMIGDYIFALWNHLRGVISREEMEVYEALFDGTINNLSAIAFLKDVHCYILLNDEPRNCKFRVEHQRGNKSEEGIPLAYYEGIDDLHFDLFVNRLIPAGIVPTIVLTWGQYDDVASLWERLTRIVSGGGGGGGCAPTASVRFVNSRPQHIEDDICDFYNAMTGADDASNGMVCWRKGCCSRVYVNRGIMRIAPEEKGVVNDAAAAYDIRFHRNEYKRVVLWHLSQLHEVCFYE